MATPGFLPRARPSGFWTCVARNWHMTAKSPWTWTTGAAWPPTPAAQGLRLLALACKRADAGKAQLDMADMEHGFMLLALVGIIDPPREEAMQAVRECHHAGIRVKMITGDHAETARAIGAQLGIGAGKPAITGAELALMDDAALRSRGHGGGRFRPRQP
jgi:hypothetical protein